MLFDCTFQVHVFNMGQRCDNRAADGWTHSMITGTAQTDKKWEHYIVLHTSLRVVWYLYNHIVSVHTVTKQHLTSGGYWSELLLSYLMKTLLKRLFHNDNVQCFVSLTGMQGNERVCVGVMRVPLPSICIWCNTDSGTTQTTNLYKKDST